MTLDSWLASRQVAIFESGAILLYIAGVSLLVAAISSVDISTLLFLVSLALTALTLCLKDKYGGVNTPEDRANMAQWIVWVRSASLFFTFLGVCVMHPTSLLLTGEYPWLF